MATGTAISGGDDEHEGGMMDKGQMLIEQDIKRRELENGKYLITGITPYITKEDYEEALKSQPTRQEPGKDQKTPP